MKLPPDFWPFYIWIPFGINLLTTLIGIIFTVFFVDRKIKNRDEKRLEPLRNIVYDRLSIICDNIFNGLLSEEYKEDMKMVMVQLGNDPNNSHSAYFYDFKKRPIPEVKSFNYFSENWNNWDPMIVPVLGESINEVRDILELSSFLLEPQLLTYLYNLRESLTYFLQTNDEFSGDEELYESQKKEINSSARDIAIATKDVYLWLGNKLIMRPM